MVTQSFFFVAWYIFLPFRLFGFHNSAAARRKKMKETKREGITVEKGRNQGRGSPAEGRGDPRSEVALARAQTVKQNSGLGQLFGAVGCGELAGAQLATPAVRVRGRSSGARPSAHAETWL